MRGKLGTWVYDLEPLVLVDFNYFYSTSRIMLLDGT
jgi:hypothetical protein